MSDFDDRPFAAGSLVGIRTFGVCDGVLVGISIRAPFLAGVNEARCARVDRDHFRDVLVGEDFEHLTWLVEMQATFAAITDSLKVLTESMRPPRSGWLRRRQEAPAEPQVHQVAGKRCACGFYAYTDTAPSSLRFGATPYLISKGICAEGLIEGYGVCTVGSKGFRASKARLLALIGPPNPALDDYGVPTYATREQALAAHPLTITEAAS